MSTVHLALMSCCLQDLEGLLECWHDSWHRDQGARPLGPEVHRGLCSAQVSSPCWPVRVTDCFGVADLTPGCFHVLGPSIGSRVSVVGAGGGAFCHVVLCT